MFLKEKCTDHLIRILDLDELFDGLRPMVRGRDQCGEEEQDPEAFAKAELVFPSGEPLPRCWLTADYPRSA